MVFAPSHFIAVRRGALQRNTVQRYCYCMPPPFLLAQALTASEFHLPGCRPRRGRDFFQFKKKMTWNYHVAPLTNRTAARMIQTSRPQPAPDFPPQPAAVNCDWSKSTSARSDDHPLDGLTRHPNHINQRRFLIGQYPHQFSRFTAIKSDWSMQFASELDSYFYPIKFRR